MDAIATALEELTTAVAGLGIPASQEPAEVRPPGAWVALDQLQALTLGGALQVTASVFLIAPDTTTPRAVELLAPMLRQLLTVIHPDGPVITQGVVLPDSTTPLPALRVPVNLKA